MTEEKKSTVEDKKTVEKPVVEKTAVKAPVKKEDKVETKLKTETKPKAEKKAEKKEEKVEKNKRMIKTREQKQRPKMSEEAKENAELVSEKSGHPQFRGRFGKNSLRRKNKPKWMKWRVPRGKDLDKTRQYGKRPDSGYRTTKATRDIHPSGYNEMLIHNREALEAVKKESFAVRVGSSVGKKKKNEIIKRANELGVKVLN